MNCREFTAEFEERSALTQAATLHLNDCPGCKKTSAEQTRVWQMIDDLKRVDAPNDFDFRVKARIANKKPADFQPRFYACLRYVLPLGLVVLILGAVIFNTAYFSDGSSSPAIAENIQQTPSAAEIPSSNSVSPEQFPPIINSQQSFTNEKVFVDSPNQSIKTQRNEQEAHFVAVKSTRKLPARLSKENRREAEDEGAGSHDISVRPPPPPILPSGISPNQSVETNPNAGDSKSAGGHILSFIGIETISESGGRKVKSVMSGSAAERSGVKVGDVIEAIDGKQIGGEPMKTFEGKKLTVVRGGEKIEINLPNKQN
jgi:hypothetical protein